MIFIGGLFGFFLYSDINSSVACFVAESTSNSGVGVILSPSLVRMKGGSSHLRRKKSKRAKRMYDDVLSVSKADAPKLKRLLPYG